MSACCRLPLRQAVDGSVIAQSRIMTGRNGIALRDVGLCKHVVVWKCALP